MLANNAQCDPSSHNRFEMRQRTMTWSTPVDAHRGFE